LDDGSTKYWLAVTVTKAVFTLRTTSYDIGAVESSDVVRCCAQCEHRLSCCA